MLSSFLRKLDENVTLFFRKISRRFQTWMEKITRPLRSWLRPKFSLRLLEYLEKMLDRWWVHIYFFIVVVPIVFILPFLQNKEEPDWVLFIYCFIVFALIIPPKKALLLLVRYIIREKINKDVRSNLLNNEQNYLGKILYLRRLKLDHQIKLKCPPHWSEPINNAGLGSGAEWGLTFDGSIVRALGFNAPIIKLASQHLDDLGFATLEMPIDGNDEWFSTFRTACENAKLIFVLPFVEEESALLRELAHIHDKELLAKTVFIMPTENVVDMGGSKERVSNLWGKARRKLSSEFGIELPKYSHYGGLVIGDADEFKLCSWISGRIWFSKHVLYQLAEKGNLNQSAFSLGLCFAKGVTFFAVMFFILNSAFLGFTMVGSYFLISYFFPELGETILAQIEKSGLQNYLLVASLIILHVASLWVIIQRFFSNIFNILCLIVSALCLPAAFFSATFVLSIVRAETEDVAILLPALVLFPILFYFCFLFLSGILMFFFDPSKGVLPYFPQSSADGGKDVAV